MIVVSDTSVICNLFFISHLDLLSKLFENVIIPPKVLAELIELEKFGYDIEPITTASFLRVETPENKKLIAKLMVELDEGEAEAIALALELNADLILIDETKGRSIAQNVGLEITGLLGILLRAKQNGLIPKVKPVLDDLINISNFFISNKVYQLILTKADE